MFHAFDFILAHPSTRTKVFDVIANPMKSSFCNYIVTYVYTFFRFFYILANMATRIGQNILLYIIVSLDSQIRPNVHIVALYFPTSENILEHLKSQYIFALLWHYTALHKPKILI